jgi:transcriptional regulator with XRE-family HTH domain
MAAEPFGNRVRERRIQEGLSQEELAEQVGISRNYLSQIERGQATNLSWHVMDRLASALGLKLEPGDSVETLPDDLPVGLEEFARNAKLPEEDIQMLARLQYRGKRPTTPEQWKMLYSIIKAAIEAQM